MKAAVALSYGDADPSIEMRNDWPKPVRQQGKKQILVRTLACSTAIGDVHKLSGRVSFIMPCSFPYIVGKDVCGVVEEADANSKFKPGDVVVGSKDFEAYGGMAEYVVLQESKACLKPAAVDTLLAACCTDSAVTAMHAVEASKIKAGERVLVLGGSGGVGSSLVQLAKLAAPSFLAATSTQAEMLRPLGVDMVVDYRTQNWWEMEEFAAKPFDVIIDCVGGGNHFAKASKVMKSKWRRGRFVAVVGDEPLPVARNLFQILGFALRMLWKPFWTLFAPWVPRYVMVVSGTTSQYLSKVVTLMEGGKLKIVLDPCSPLPFTAEGVKTAFRTQASGHAHGKVVVQVAEGAAGTSQ